MVFPRLCKVDSAFMACQNMACRNDVRIEMKIIRVVMVEISMIYKKVRLPTVVAQVVGLLISNLSKCR